MDQSYPKRQGKTALRLAEDISLYDSTKPPITGRNLLSQVPPVYAKDWNGPLEFIADDACKHNYVTKTDQTSLTEGESLHREGVTKVCAICSKCRWHLQLVVTNNNASWSNASDEKHLHIFVYKSGRQKTPLTDAETMETGQTAETFHYECAKWPCQTYVSLRLMSPILNPRFTALLTDPELIRQRAMQAFESQPQRLEGMAFPSPITVLDNLRLYLNNALRFSDRSKPITQNNKRFMISFGIKAEPCHELLEFLGFVYRKTESDGAWEPPNLGNDPSTPFQEPAQIFIDDTIHELVCLINQIPPAERRELQPASLPPTSTHLIERALGAMARANDRRPRTREEERAFHELGLGDEVDVERLLACCDWLAAETPEFWEDIEGHMKTIARYLGGQDEIDIERHLALQAGEATETAWKTLGLDFEKKDSTSEAALATALYERIDEIDGYPAEAKLRSSLAIIAADLNSQRLQDISTQHLNRVSDAYAFLGYGANDKTEDVFIDAIRAAKVADSPEDQMELVQVQADRAVQTIATHRNSFINETRIAPKMDINGAYSFFGIDEHSVDDMTVHAAYIIAQSEPDKDKDKSKEAINLIMDHRNSNFLRALIEQQEPAEHDPSEWPVGLTNIGNTCYLNSLFQFHFSLGPFRDMVMNIDDFKMDLSDEASIADRKVGLHRLTKKEVEDAINVIRGLGVHFENMVKTPGTDVTPTKELAKLMLEGLSGGETRDHSETDVSQSHALGEIDGAPVLGPAGPPMETSEAIPEESVDVPTVTVTTEDVEMKENSPGDDQVTEVETVTQSSQPEQPTRAPPVPPRPSPQPQSKVWVEVTKQQDVTEVIRDVLLQAQCAIKPDGVVNGEQIDKITEMFYGTTVRNVTKGQNPKSFPDDLWCDLAVNVAQGPRDIYEALDDLFDPEWVDSEDGKLERYGSIRKIPPVLQIQVQRALFDKEKGQYKSNNHLQLYETIYMDRYMESADPTLLEKRNQGWKLKNHVGGLEADRDELVKAMEPENGGKSVLNSASHMLGDSSESDSEQSLVSDELSEEMQECAEEVTEEVNVYDHSIETTKNDVAQLFNAYQQFAYRLYAVFVHSGSANFGHYWVYIFDHRKGIWRKYNDEKVTEVKDLDEIFKERQTNPKPTPYFVVYVSADRLDEMADPVCRHLDQSTPMETDE